MLIGQGVFCDICPIKSMCKHENSSACYRISIFLYQNNQKILKDGDFQKQQESTINCPILNLLSSIDPILKLLISIEGEKDEIC